MSANHRANRHQFEDWSAPTAQAASELEWTLRHGAPTREDLLCAASILNAYRHLLTHPAGTEVVVKQLRQLRRRERGQ